MSCMRRRIRDREREAIRCGISLEGTVSWQRTPGEFPILNCLVALLALQFPDLARPDDPSCITFACKASTP
ncbi:hypothetical protein COLO4_19292 [Corchorus olitorius]|uniref:Uncharacterized protein n=1 Tax=Corchorus olitorius TaxID=93759 RepID=A0A1R3J5U2_9ROSI|nr:hypothetical protein COLO4_19292 [Corchorus olitorius]